MLSNRAPGLLVAMLAVLAIPAADGQGAQGADDLPKPPALSTLAPVADLVEQVDYYVGELEECVEDQDEYEDSVDKIYRYSNTLAAIALAIGLHDQVCDLRNAAPALIEASRELSRAEDFAAARAGVERIKSALNAEGDPSTLRWHKVAEMKALMDQVPMINTRLKRYMRRFERGAPYIAESSAALVAVSQASLANADDTKEPDRVAEWYQFCIQMRDASAALNDAARDGDETAAEAAMDDLQQSCDDCHAVFHKDDDH